MTWLVWILFAFTGLLLLLAVLAEYFSATFVKRFSRKIVRRTPHSLADLQGHVWFPLDNLAYIEKFIPNLKRVVVICAIVERPTRRLLDAVTDNFQEGVIYDFFVSNQGNSREELAKYYAWFENVYGAAKGIAPLEGSKAVIHGSDFSDVVSVKILPMAWSNVPYIFYLFSSPNSDAPSIVAFRGIEKGSGISQEYWRIHPDEAQAIIDLCSAQSRDFREVLPLDEIEILDELPREAEIVPISASSTKRQRHG